jgi:hypothetical protein
MPPPSPVWTRKGEYHNATFRMDVRIEGGWYTSEKVKLNVKGAPKSKEREPEGEANARLLRPTSSNSCHCLTNAHLLS